MNKVLLKCKDGVKEYSYKKAKIYTATYTRKLTPTSIHSPRAAKIIFTDAPNMYVLLLKMPIIHVDHNGDVVIWTMSTINEVTLVDKYEFDNSTLSDYKAHEKLLKAKQHLGLTQEERLLKSVIDLEVEMIYLVKNLSLYKEGGGFND